MPVEIVQRPVNVKDMILPEVRSSDVDPVHYAFREAIQKAGYARLSGEDYFSHSFGDVGKIILEAAACLKILAQNHNSEASSLSIRLLESDAARNFVERHLPKKIMKAGFTNPSVRMLNPYFTTLAPYIRTIIGRDFRFSMNAITRPPDTLTEQTRLWAREAAFTELFFFPQLYKSGRYGGQPSIDFMWDVHYAKRYFTNWPHEGMKSEKEVSSAKLLSFSKLMYPNYAWDEVYTQDFLELMRRFSLGEVGGDTPEQMITRAFHYEILKAKKIEFTKDGILFDRPEAPLFSPTSTPLPERRAF